QGRTVGIRVLEERFAAPSFRTTALEQPRARRYERALNHLVRHQSPSRQESGLLHHVDTELTSTVYHRDAGPIRRERSGLATGEKDLAVISEQSGSQVRANLGPLHDPLGGIPAQADAWGRVKHEGGPVTAGNVGQEHRRLRGAWARCA